MPKQGPAHTASISNGLNDPNSQLRGAKRSKPSSNLSKGSIRPYLLITLRHAEGKGVSPQAVIDRISCAFTSRSIVVTTEKHGSTGLSYWSQK